jgi:uncharacterized membrane protein (UPF0127 family)
METPPLEKPQKKLSPITLAVIVLTLLFAVGLRVHQALALRKVIWAELAVRGKTFQVEVADTPAKLEKGLGERDGLPRDHGMYFPFAEAKHWVFWMKGMRFPIDIVWIRDGKVVDITPDVQVDQGLPLKTYSPVEPADAVLELDAGVAREIGLQDGDALTLTAR